MISGISVSGGTSDNCSRYEQFNNNGYIIDQNLNSVQSDRLPYASKQLNETLDIKMSSNPIVVTNQWYQNASKKMPIGERQFSTSTDDSDSSGSFKNASEHLQQMNLCNGKNDEEKPLLPDHHARRPMNAFLIFCKRHRGIVRDRYPNLENRAITKILGDWWANLDENEKSSYTNLAKEYKDAFFNANPDFKWYKLPAPPLRTSGPRISNDRHASFSSDHDEHNGFDFDAPSTKFSNKFNDSNDVGTFKLADEAQMGGLNSLMVEADVKNGKCANNNNNNTKLMANAMEIDGDRDDDEKDGDTSENKDELHRVLGETRSFLQDTMKGYEQLDEYLFEMNASNSNIPQKSLHSPASNGSSPETKHFESDSPDDDMSGYDSVFGPKKSSRACKGKRYMEFMNAQKLNIIGKRTKPRTASSSSATSLSPTQPLLHMRQLKKSLSCSQAVQKLDYDTFDHVYANQSAVLLTSTATMKKMDHVIDSMVNEATTNNNTIATAANDKSKTENGVSPVDCRKFDVTEFELEQKINALQAHNLDNYLARKQDTKKKKKTNEKRSSGGYRKVHKIGKSKNKSTSPRTAAVTAAAAAMAAASVPIVVTEPKTIEEAKQRLAMVGSQKRKARKESITRRDVQQVTAIVQSYATAMIEPHFMPVVPSAMASSALATGAASTNTNRCGNSNGLLMLATMAEVAAANYAA